MAHGLHMKVGQTSFFDLKQATSSGAFQGDAPADIVVEWSSSDDAVATVAIVDTPIPGKSATACAIVTAVGPGTCTITGNAQGVTDSLQVEVTGNTVGAVKIAPGKPS